MKLHNKRPRTYLFGSDYERRVPYGKLPGRSKGYE
jgi:hypothetical protein